jgi:nucleotide-binding universal stress UspA family protein
VSFKTIVLGLDGSEHGDRALGFAEELAKEGGGEIVAVYVRELIAGRGGTRPVHVDADETEAKVKGEVDALNGRGVKAQMQVGTIALGGPAQVISDIAKEANADLIVVGTRGRSAIRGLFLGSVTTRLLHLAHVPVLAIPPASHE